LPLRLMLQILYFASADNLENHWTAHSFRSASHSFA
jgi:hypothetical protein